MKPLFLCFFVGTVVLTSCLKEPVEPQVIVEPPQPVEVKLDSIVQGTLYNVTIGDEAEKVYSDLQQFSETEKPIAYLGITGQFNTKLHDLENRIPLYSALILDRKPSSPEGGQIYFEGNVIKSIYSRNGIKLQTWPNSSSTALKVGDIVDTVYDKLTKLHSESRYAGLFAYIGMFDKNIETEFDPIQEKSTLWQFSIAEDDKNFIRIDLVFEDGILTKIRSRHERYL